MVDSTGKHANIPVIHGMMALTDPMQCWKQAVGVFEAHFREGGKYDTIAMFRWEATLTKQQSMKGGDIGEGKGRMQEDQTGPRL